MNLGLSTIAQVVDGWARQALTDIVAALTTGYHTEHNADDTHRTIHASGAIYERGRTTAAMGEAISVPYAQTDFTASGTMTWTVDNADVVTFAYTLVGKTMTVWLALQTTSVGGVVSSVLKVKIPGGFMAKRNTYTAANLFDSGTWVTGHLRVQAGATVIEAFQLGSSNFTASANNTWVVGTITFEVA